MAHALDFDNQDIHPAQKLLARCMRVVGKQLERVLGEFAFSGLARPPAYLAIGKQCEATEVTHPSCVLQITQHVVETQTGIRGTESHAAAQHNGYRGVVQALPTA